MNERKPNADADADACPTSEESPCVWDKEKKCRCCERCVFACLEAGFRDRSLRDE